MIMSRPRILLVEDNIQDSRLLKEILESRDFTVEVCNQVAEACRLIQRTEYDLVITDIALPDASGLELIPFVKMHRPLTEIIVITGHASLDSAIQATDDGAAAYITKPFNLPHLLSRIKKVLEKRQLTLENRRLLQELQKVNAELREKVQQLEALHQSVIEAERLSVVQQLVVTLSHKINNSITGILGALQVLAQNAPALSSDAQEVMGRIEQEATKIKTTINRLKELKSLRVVPYLNDITMIDLNL